ncbi:1-acyl-sn-glycerol-3-phosphate acyltransferase [Membranicola marinus]|uniref:1-acyl-sn-glycerol-3-phosphate acyltransferase n=1 Tax=Membranihabitans marinus TaxID=1227546 RepID=A0A953HS31_9BACT|nr:lysophospholipid acyltransferase family protein [Membranihabitans marinus]MBY5959903.1 1-acyl-sn-glycerol-3-phosphate acyltransferase [Membranihabitans marinus]
MSRIATHFIAGLKLTLFFGVLVVSIVVLSIRLIFAAEKNKQKIKFLARRRFCKHANWILGVRLIVLAKRPPEGCYLYISNHRSFYDPVAFLSHLVANPVSKAEVSRYPIIGWGTRLTEVLMLDRGKKEDRQKMKFRIFESLRDGTDILLYPEGTTHTGPGTGSFKKGAFESAVRAQRSVIPVAMEYPNETYYWSDRPLYDQFLYQFITARNRSIYLSVGEPISDPDPITLMNRTKESINQQIMKLRQVRAQDQDVD